MWSLTYLLLSLMVLGWTETPQGDPEGRPTSHAPPKVFRFHLFSEPQSLDPAYIKGNASEFLFANLYRSLYRYDADAGLIPEGAKNCIWETAKFLRCELNTQIKWSDGTPVTAEQYVRAFQRIQNPTTASPLAEILLPLKKIAAPSTSTLTFEFSSHDPDFLYKMTFPGLSPIKTENFPKIKDAAGHVFNGPYRITQWKAGRLVRLEPNPYYPFKKIHKKPLVEAVIVEDDATALRLFDLGQLNYLRRLTTANIPKYKDHPGFFQVPLARFDYVGFGPELLPHPNLREALIYSLNYPELKKLYDALGVPGCTSLPARLTDKKTCYNFDLVRAQKALAKVPEDIRKRTWNFYFSRAAGDDIQKGMEWMQDQWKKHLGVKVSLNSREQGMYYHELAVKPPPIFRKGVGLDRPTCLAAVELFVTENSENYIKYKNAEFDQAVQNLRSEKDPQKIKVKCRQTIEKLLADHRLIPLGEIYFTMLEDRLFKGWSVNDLNQLDLTELEVRQPLRNSL